MKRERITIELDVGADDRLWAKALGVGRSFATEFIDRAPGFRCGVGYRVDAAFPGGSRTLGALWVHWTAARAVVVRQIPYADGGSCERAA